MPEERNVNSLFRAENMRPFVFGGLGFGFAGAMAVAGGSDIDGGAIKFFWSSLQTASPPVAIGAVVAVIVIWTAWQKDRKEHSERTIDYVDGMNKAARLREYDVREKSRLRDQVRELERRQRRGGR